MIETNSQQHMVRYPRLRTLQADIAECRTLSRLTNEPHCMALDGHTGAGKSWLVRDYATLFPRTQEITGDRVPVFYAEIPAPVTVKGTASRLLHALKDPAFDRGTLHAMDARLVNFIQSCQVELVILDDFHHLLDRDGKRVIIKVAQWLKSLIKLTGVPFLVVGIQGEVERILKADAELSRLFAVRETLHPFSWDWGNEELCAEFNQFVRYAEDVVGKRLETKLEQTELLFRIHYATHGVVAYVMKLFWGAKLLADQSGANHLSLEALQASFHKRLVKDLQASSDPFDPKHGDTFEPPKGGVKASQTLVNSKTKKSITPTPTKLEGSQISERV